MPADGTLLAELGSNAEAVRTLCETLDEQPEARVLHRRLRWTPVGEPGERFVWEQPRKAWGLLAPLLDSADLDRFAQVVEKTLPSALADQESQIARGPSKLIRRGLTYSLALLGNSDGLIRVTPPPSARATRVVSRLLKPQAERWLALAEHLALLAEAAPDAFLTGLSESLALGRDGISSLWDEHPEIIKQVAHALAILALDVDLLERAALGLAGLAADGGQPRPNVRDSHPLQCLEDIFDYYYPKTNASIEERLDVLRKICEQFEPVAWPLLMELLPEPRMFSVSLPLPQVLRISVPPRVRQAYPGEAYGQIHAFLMLALRLVGTEPQRWADLLRHLHRLPPELAIEALERLQASADEIHDEEGLVWAALRTRLHVLYDASDESSNQEEAAAKQRIQDKIYKLDELLYEKLTPARLAIRSAWAFSTGAQPPGRFRNLEEERQALGEHQQAYIRMLGQRSDRWDVLTELAERIEQPFWLAQALAMSSWAGEFETRLLAQNSFHPYEKIAFHFLAWRLVNRNFSDTSHLMRRLMAEHRYEDVWQLAIALSGTADERESCLWDLLDELGAPVRDAYWREIAVEKLYGRAQRPQQANERAICRLKELGRYDAAMRAALVLKPRASNLILLDVLAAVAEKLEASERAWQIERERLQAQGDLQAQISHSLSRGPQEDRYLVAELLEQVHPKDPMEMERARQLEAALLSLLGETHYRPRWLPKYISEHPEGFVRLCRSGAAEDLLALWDGFPGDELPTRQALEHLHQWAETVLTLLPAGDGRADGHLALAALLIRPSGTDGIWPSEAVRRLLDEHPELYKPLLDAKGHPRGIRMRRVDTLVQEARELAVRCREGSAKLQSSWPTTARLLSELAETYEEKVELQSSLDDYDHPGIPMSSPKAAAQPLFPLLKVQIENFRAAEQLNLPLHPRLTVLYGRNASGKTTVLDAVAIGLSAIARRLPMSSEDVEQRLPQFRDADRHTRWRQGKREEKAKRISVSLWGQPQERGSDPLHWLVGRPWASRGPEVADREDPQLQPYLDAVNEALRTGDTTIAMPVFAYYGVERAVSERAKEDARPPKESPSRPAGLEGALHAAAQFEKAAQWFRGMEDIEVRRQREKRDYEHPALAAVRAAIAAAVKTPDGSYVRNLRVDADTSKLRIDFVRSNGAVENLEIGQLSDGFRTHLALVLDLARRMAQCNPSPDEQMERDGFGLRSNAVVLIDEVDLHLHPAWQQTVLPGLLEAFPRAQFIVTTHSVLTLGSIQDAQLFFMDGSHAESVAAPFGKDASLILREYQGTVPRAAAVEDRINDIKSLLDRRAFDAARREVDQLETQLGVEDPDVQTLRSLLFFMGPDRPSPQPSSQEREEGRK
ncbi:MAG: AAA family ATPase [Polyangia bacterium]